MHEDGYDFGQKVSDGHSEMVVIVQRFKLAIGKQWGRRWDHLQPQFEVPFSDGESETLPAQVLDSQFDVVHSEVLKLGVCGKGKNGN